MNQKCSSTPVLNIASNRLRTRSRVAGKGLRNILIAFATALLAVPAQAQDAAAIEFDIVEQSDSLAVLLDLSFLLTSAHIARLRDGIDLGVECRMSLRRPRRLLGSVKLTERTSFCRLSYQLLTKGYRITVGQAAADTLSFASLSRLHEYMTDSVVFTVQALDSLDSEPRYILDFQISAISLNSINLASGEDAPEAARSPLKSLFEQFLVLTDYGRETFSTSSRPFSRAEITAR